MFVKIYLKLKNEVKNKCKCVSGQFGGGRPLTGQLGSNRRLSRSVVLYKTICISFDNMYNKVFKLQIIIILSLFNNESLNDWSFVYFYCKSIDEKWLEWVFLYVSMNYLMSLSVIILDWHRSGGPSDWPDTGQTLVRLWSGRVPYRSYLAPMPAHRWPYVQSEWTFILILFK